jgi:mRNA-degrading endonuclease RelE of RelBE toxin-antitoxin system
MLTVIETSSAQRMIDAIFSQEEKDDLFVFLAQNPRAGDVIPNADGARKLRWEAKGKGKRGGARVIYFNITDKGAILLVAAYAKSEQENMGGKEIKKAGQYGF